MVPTVVIITVNASKSFADTTMAELRTHTGPLGIEAGRRRGRHDPPTAEQSLMVFQAGSDLESGMSMSFSDGNALSMGSVGSGSGYVEVEKSRTDDVNVDVDVERP